MRATILFLIGFLIGACGRSAPPANTPTPGHVEEASMLEARTVALVSTDDNGNVRPYCSGVWVSPTTILTANHCVRDVELGELVDYVVKADVFAPGTVTSIEAIATHGSVLYARDQAHDLVLLGALVPPPHDVAGFTDEAIRPGMFVQTMGQPLGLWWSYSSGDVSAVRRIDVNGMQDVIFVQTTAPTSPGNSGGALFDSVGDIVGICHGSYTRGQTLNLFIHVQYARALVLAQVAP